MKNLYILMILLVSMFACNTKNEGASGIIPEEKMVKVLADVHIAEGAIVGFEVEERDSLATLYYNHIFRIHKIEEADFYRSIQYYAGSLKKYATLYDKVKTEVISKKDEVTPE